MNFQGDIISSQSICISSQSICNNLQQIFLRVSADTGCRTHPHLLCHSWVVSNKHQPGHSWSSANCQLPSRSCQSPAHLLTHVATRLPMAGPSSLSFLEALSSGGAPHQGLWSPCGLLQRKQEFHTQFNIPHRHMANKLNAFGKCPIFPLFRLSAPSIHEISSYQETLLNASILRVRLSPREY